MKDEPQSEKPVVSIYVKATDFGDDWPLTVDEGRILCRPVEGLGLHVLTFDAGDGRVFAVNGTARDVLPQHPHIDAIRKPRPDEPRLLMDIDFMFRMTGVWPRKP